jgi:hypothetical protein
VPLHPQCSLLFLQWLATLLPQDLCRSLCLNDHWLPSLQRPQLREARPETALGHPQPWVRHHSLSPLFLGPPRHSHVHNAAFAGF